MNSQPQCEQKVLFPDPTDGQKPVGQLIVDLRIPGKLPSWNDILGMEEWARYKFKRRLADDFLLELRAIAGSSSTKTTCAKSTMSTYADTLASYLAMRQAQRRSKQLKKKLEKKSGNLFESKFSESKVPF